MRHIKGFHGVILGFALGAAVMSLTISEPRAVEARTDRFEDYVMATGAVSTNPRAPTDGVWLLDYRSGRLLGTVIDRNVGKILGWAHLDLVREFQIEPRQDVHFMMTTGNIARGQAALYVAEIRTGKFGVYTMGPNPNGFGTQIIRHDLTTFRPAPAQGGQPPLPAQPGGLPIVQPGPG